MSRRLHTAMGLAGAAVLLTAAGLVAAQDNRTAPVATPPPGPAADAPTAVPPGAPPPVTTAVPDTPGAKALADAVTPEEGPPQPKADETPKPLKAEAPPKPPPEPLKRPRYTSAVMQAVDKITAETLRFETKVGEPVRYKGLILTVRSCETTAADETAPDNVAYLDVQSQPVHMAQSTVAPRQVFRGWMFANSPSLHPFEHPIYDLWLVACKTAAPDAAAPIAPKSPAGPDKASAKRS